MKKLKTFVLLGVPLLVYSATGFAAPTDDVFGVWASLTLQGDFTFFSPGLENLKWLIMDQSRTRDDSPKGTRYSENLLFSQIGYQATENASFWLGYVHDWIHPLNKTAFQENRPYQDFLWTQKFEEFSFLARSRMEERIHQTSGDTGYRYRQFFQISHPLPILDHLSAYLGDEVFFYLNKTSFGKQGFTENRILTGLSYQFTKQVGMDLGYLGQYVDNPSGHNLFTHNLQANVRLNF